jgi:hypothetical protein
LNKIERNIMKIVSNLILLSGFSFAADSTINGRSPGKIHPQAMAKRDFTQPPNSLMSKARSVYNAAVEKLNSATAEGAQLNPSASASAEIALEQGQSLANNAFAQVSDVILATGSLEPGALASASSVISQGEDAAASKFFEAASYLDAGLQASPGATSGNVEQSSITNLSPGSEATESSRFETNRNIPSITSTGEVVGSGRVGRGGTGESHIGPVTASGPSTPRINNGAVTLGCSSSLYGLSVLLVVFPLIV